MGKLLLFLVICSLTAASCQKAQLGTVKNPVKIYFTPSVDSDTIATNSKEFIRFLEQETKLYFKTGIPTNYIAVVEALGSERADIAVINSFGYLMANEKYQASAKLRTVRHGHDYYQGQIIAHVDSGIKTVKDLQGKRVAFTDPSSTSGYMFPLKILKDNQVTPGHTIFVNKHDNVVTSIYQKQVDAGATYYSAPDSKGTIRDARARVKTQFPDVEEKIKIVAITEKIPNDPFVFRKDLPQEVVDKFIDAVKKYLSTENGKKVFNRIYSVEGVVQTNDKSYDGLRKMLKAIKVDVTQYLK